jgi:hypothetical protein
LELREGAPGALYRLALALHATAPLSGAGVSAAQSLGRLLDNLSNGDIALVRLGVDEIEPVVPPEHDRLRACSLQPPLERQRS